jgi:hypothetical protein
MGAIASEVLIGDWDVDTVFRLPGDRINGTMGGPVPMS